MVKRILITLAFFLCSIDALAAPDKTDVVVMNNGDHLVGEIKKLEFGQLTFKASYMADSVNLDWTKVQQLESVRRFRVELENGDVLSGSIVKRPPSDNTADFEVTGLDGKVTLNFVHVVGLEPLERSLWRRLKGSADVGFTLHPENDQTDITTNASVNFPSERFLVTTQFSSDFSRQQGAEDSKHASFGTSYYQFLSKSLFASGVAQALQNNQLDLDLRTTFGGGVGRFLIHTNRTVLTAMAGAGWTRELYFDPSNNKKTAEGLIGIQFYYFHFASSQIDTRILIYPGITEWGRIRMDWQTNLTWEVWKNAFWKVSILENYDSRPPEGSRRNDFTLTNTFGVSF